MLQEDDMEVKMNESDESEDEHEHPQRDVYELTDKQQVLYKGIEQDMLTNFLLPTFAVFLPEVQNSVKKMLNPDNKYRKLVQDHLNDRDLQDYLNACKEDLYKQLLQNYKATLKTSVANKWFTNTLKRLGTTPHLHKDDYHNDVKYLQATHKIVWFNTTLQFAQKLLKESDSETLTFDQRAQQRVHFVKIMCFILQIESTEFTQLFKKMFDEL